jgi:hypothetical protein
VKANRSDRGRLQETVGELGDVHPYRQRIDDMRHRLTGWWLTPAAAQPGCLCELCIAARERRDVHLGSITRTAIYEAGRLALEHQESVAA